MPDSPTKGIGKWISIIHRKTQMHMNHASSEIGLNLTESLYLTHLKEDRAVNRKWLTDHLSMDDALTTRTLRGLEERGLIIQERSETDQRQLSVRLTSKGASLVPLILRAHRLWLEELTRDFTPDETKRAGYMLEQMAVRAIACTEKRTEAKSC